jgi:hypothetical protein
MVTRRKNITKDYELYLMKWNFLQNIDSYSTDEELPVFKEAIGSLSFQQKFKITLYLEPF